MIGVIWVVRNRHEHPDFPETVCGVVRDGGERNPCLFSSRCDGNTDSPTDGKSWSPARRMACDVLTDPPADSAGGALFFPMEDLPISRAVTQQRPAHFGRQLCCR